jgi:diphthamide synthase (EF-2-diphthine--ammonia ligase)
VDPRVLPASFAGRAFDRALLRDLPTGVDPCGENGEFHSFAWDGPMFDHPVPITPGAVVERDGFVFADLLPATDDSPQRSQRTRREHKAGAPEA